MNSSEIVENFRKENKYSNESDDNVTNKPKALIRRPKIYFTCNPYLNNSGLNLNISKENLKNKIEFEQQSWQLNNNHQTLLECNTFVEDLSNNNNNNNNSNYEHNNGDPKIYNSCNAQLSLTVNNLDNLNIGSQDESRRYPELKIPSNGSRTLRLIQMFENKSLSQQNSHQTVNTRYFKKIDLFQIPELNGDDENSKSKSLIKSSNSQLPSPSKSPAQTDNWATTNPQDARLRLKESEDKYHQKKFKSTLIETLYPQKEEEQNKNSIPVDTYKSKARVHSGSGHNDSNNLEFNDSSIDDIDADDSESNSKNTDQINNKNNKFKFSNQSSFDISASNKKQQFIKQDLFGFTPNNTNQLRFSSFDTDSQKVLHEEMNIFVNEVAGTGPSRVKWCDMPQVVNNKLNISLSSDQRKLHEALFEVITSEASYYRMLNIFIDKFYNAPCMKPGEECAVVTHFQKHHLFSNILEIHLTSGNFLCAMEQYFREDPMLTKLCIIIYKHAEFEFGAYVRYVQNQIYQLRTLSQLLQCNAFTDAIKSLQNQSAGTYLDLNSFLLLPMQRVTRLRLLVSVILRYTPCNTITYKNALIALASLENLIKTCDEKKAHMEQKERLVDLCRKLEYRFDAKSLATESRTLFKEGDLRLLSTSNVESSAFRQRFSSIRRPKQLFARFLLFTDHLLITKKRSNHNLIVEESCPLDYIEIKVPTTPANNFVKIFYYSEERNEKLLPNYISYANNLSRSSEPSALNVNNDDLNSAKRGNLRKFSTDGFQSQDIGLDIFSFSIHVEGPDHPAVRYEMQAKSLCQRERWIDALCPSFYGIPKDLSFEVERCPKVSIKRAYSALECDELELKEGDTVSVLISLSDGWLKGVLADGKRGWFPDNICVEIKDSSIITENNKDFLILHEAKLAYRLQKQKEKFGQFRATTPSPTFTNISRQARNKS